MGYMKRPGTEITDFTPDDTDTTMYIEGSMYVDLITLLNKAKEKWPEADFADINIDAEHIHTHALYYDRYDGSDYTNYIVLTYHKPK
jgi:hypothetical protein